MAQLQQLQNRRWHRRHSFRLPIRYQVDGASVDAYTIDLSLGGAYIATIEPPHFNQVIEVRFQVWTQPEPIEVEAQVRWSEPGRGMGVHFAGLRPRDVWALNKFFYLERRDS